MRTFFQSTLFLALLSSCITLTSASGGVPQAPKAESTMDTSKPLHQNIIEQALNQTTNAKAYNPEGVIDNSQESALMAKIGSLTDAHGPTYNQDNPFPRPFWPQNVKFQGKMWAGVMFSLWFCILGTYVYIKISGMDYATLFPEGVENLKRTSGESGDSKEGGAFVKSAKRNIHEIIEENESGQA